QLASVEPGPRATALRRYLAATPPELARDARNLRWQVIAAERDEAAGTIAVRLRVTNAGSAEQRLELDGARLAGLDIAQPPGVEPRAGAGARARAALRRRHRRARGGSGAGARPGRRAASV